ncbi:ficolin-1-like [Exaiptasia diaphana]|uniref:Fibrinogen C-terminal domain-containing protein n=1 Tax=Exaiptasia diaphana TaxID=2652724 RepID=A0A913YHW2_EXADI|nr:ficolin-1-like [Exaiptasia diaphana]
MKPSLSPSFLAYCDMVTNGGGWTIFQRRLDGSVDFYRGWHDYKQGFGNENGEYWLGLDRIHAMTSKGNFRLRIDLEDFEGNARYAEYDSFSVSDEADKYRLSIGKYSGTARDCLTSHNKMAFSTNDRDNDVYSKSCAVMYKGAWWYSSCHSSNLNGLYLRGNTSQYGTGVTWSCFKGLYYSLKISEMKIRPD